MYLAAVRFGKGWVRFRVEAAGAETLLSEAARQGLRLWNVRRRGRTAEGCVAAREYRALCRIGRRMGLRPRLAAKHGLPFYACRLWRRKGLLIGVIGCAACLVLSQNFLWEIRVNGSGGIHTDHLEEVMQAHGIRIGAYHPALDLPVLQQELLMELDDVSWLALNRDGTVLEVEVSQKDAPPERQETRPCNIVAGRSGQITAMEVYRGQKMVSVRDTVARGDLLVSGILENERGAVRQVHADAKIMAVTQRSRTVRFALRQQERIPTGGGTQRRSLKLLGVRIPLYFDFSLPYPAWKTERETPLSILGTEYPVSLIQEEHRYYRTESRTYSRSEARRILREELERYQREELSGVTVLSWRDTWSEEEGVVSVTREYRCEENIAAKLQLSTHE